MANTLTGLIPTIYTTLDTVSRELVGLIPAVTRDGKVSRAAKDQTVSSPVAPAASATDVTAAMTVPTGGDQTIGKKDITISKVRAVPINWTGEEALSLSQGVGQAGIFNDQLAQAFRTLTNEMEADLALLHKKFSRAYGTAGTTPFATAADFTDASETRRILVDNGAPQSDMHLIINSAAGAKLRGKQADSTLQGSDRMLRQGVLLDHSGMALRESAQILTSTAGTATSATTDNAGYAVGATTITLASAGTGTLVAGDVITFAGDSNKYLVTSGDADVSNGGTITIAAPGLRVAMSAATKAITVVAAAARNMAFTRNAIVLANRLPALPPGGRDLAVDRLTIQDPYSGIAFELALYLGYRMVHYELSAAWGCEVMKPEHTAILLG
jgi:hypothetical protein